MSHSKKKHHNRRTRFPIKLTLFTAFCALVVFALYFFEQTISDNWIPSVESAFAVLAGIILGTVCIVAWTVWFLRRKSLSKRLRMGMLLAIAIPTISFLVLFEPVPGGGLFPDRWRARFWQRSLASMKGSGRADLMTVTANDFPQFFGARRDGTVSGTKFFENWDLKPPKLRWKQEIGYGWSGFVVVNQFAVTMEQRGSDECISCYRVDDGKLVWFHRYPARHEDPLGGIGPRATPAIVDGKVYTIGACGDVHCLDGADGSVLWKQSLLDLLGIESETLQTIRGVSKVVEKSGVSWGRSGSPLVYKNLVICPAGGNPGNTVSLIAFDKNTGDEVWRGGREQIGYGSPTVAKILGEDQILIVNESSVSGHDPDSGKELWNYRRSGKSSADANNSQPTVISENQILLSKGYGMGGELIRLSKSDDGFDVISEWKSSRVLKTKLTNPVIYQGHAYSLSHGILECARVEDGQQMWKEGRFGHGQILLVGDQLLVHSEKGMLHLIRATPDRYHELSNRKTIRGVCWNMLCLAGNQLIVRSDVEAACFELPIADDANRADENSEQAPDVSPTN